MTNMKKLLWLTGAGLLIAGLVIIYLLRPWSSASIKEITCNAQAEQIKFYKNPIAKHGDFADPFILKYNGRYYLYCTNPGVKCWSSADLMDWKLEGTVIGENQLEGMVPFAPEVVYWNGAFYMYTSPSGSGHYVLKSESPTGPFILQTDNIGYKIDGSVFIDDDGKWYFYHADDEGIKTYTMKDPVTIGEEVGTEVFMDGWTEGPGVIKRNGKYYLTYTGNHYLSKGYRINYAVSDNPVKGFLPYSKNPFIINTEGEGTGLGHSMSFTGPDLVSWFITYHNLNDDVSRDLNIDRLAWNGDKMVVFGPTAASQTAPEMPDFFENFDKNEAKNKWLSKYGDWKTDNGFLRANALDSENRSLIVSEYESGENYTAEFNMKSAEKAAVNESRFGAVISYSDDKNYGLLLLNPVKNTVETQFTVNGKDMEKVVSSLPEGYDFTKLHCIKVEKYGTEFNISIDGMKKQTRTVSGLGIGNIGFYSEGTGTEFGYTALTNTSGGDSIFKAFKPIPGTLEAVHYNLGGEGTGYHIKSKESMDNELREDGVYIEPCGEGGYNSALKSQGEWLAYNVNIGETADYNMDLRAAQVKPGTKIKLWLDNDAISGPMELDVKKLNEWRTVAVKGLKLKEGLHILRVQLIGGGFKLYNMGFYKAGSLMPDFKESFDANLKNWSYINGLGQEFEINKGMLKLGPYGKIAAGENGWDDYTAEVDVKGEATLKSGIIFRVSNPAEGGEGTDSMLGTNFYQGYFAGIKRNGVVLGKQSYNWKELSSAKGSYAAGKTYHLKVVVKGDNIKVFVNDMETPKIDYTDKEPFTHGKAGIRVEGAVSYFDNFIVSDN